MEVRDVIGWSRARVGHRPWMLGALVAVACTALLVSPRAAEASAAIAPALTVRARRIAAAPAGSSRGRAALAPRLSRRAAPLFAGLAAAAAPVIRDAAGRRAADATIEIEGSTLPTMGAVPPDPTGAIGPRDYVEMINQEIAVYARRDLRLVARLDLNSFWGVSSFTMMDPQIAWDPGSRRWYVAGFEKGDESNVMFGWSKTSDPRDLMHGWCRYTRPSGRYFPDFPMLGFSRAQLVIGANMAGQEEDDEQQGENKVLFSRLYAIAKPARGARACPDHPSVTIFGTREHPLRQADGHPAVTPVPAREVSRLRRAWVFATDCTSAVPIPNQDDCGRPHPRSHQVTAWFVSGPRGDPRLHRRGGIEIGEFRGPRPVPQPHTRNRIDPSDTRLSLAVANRDPSEGGVGAVWFSHAVAGPRGRAVIRWYEVDPRRLEVLRRGTIGAGRNWAMYPAISPTRRGDSAVIDYVTAGRRLLPQLWARHRGRGDPPGTLRRRVRLGASRARLAPVQCEDRLCRYGDYAGASPDPLRPDVVWGSSELSGARLTGMANGLDRRDWPNWTTRNFAIRSPAGPRRRGHRRRGRARHPGVRSLAGSAR